MVPKYGSIVDGDNIFGNISKLSLIDIRNDNFNLHKRSRATILKCFHFHDVIILKRNRSGFIVPHYFFANILLSLW